MFFFLLFFDTPIGMVHTSDFYFLLSISHATPLPPLLVLPQNLESIFLFLCTMSVEPKGKAV